MIAQADDGVVVEVEVPPLVASLFIIEPSEPAETAPPVMYAPCRAAVRVSTSVFGKEKGQSRVGQCTGVLRDLYPGLGSSVVAPGFPTVLHKTQVAVPLCCIGNSREYASKVTSSALREQSQRAPG